VRRLALITALCFGAAVVNPNGYHLWVFPLETLTSSAIQAYIEEWYSPNFHASGYWPFGLMLAVGSLSMVFSKRRPTWTDLLLFFGTGAAGLISSRHIQLFAVVTIPVISRHALTLFSKSRFYFLISGDQPAPAPTRRLVILHWLALGILGLVGVFDIARTVQTNDAAMQATFPAAAVDWIEAQGWRERRMFNNYNWGGYLVWRGLPVFIDGRAEVYGDAFILRYLDTIFVRPNWREMLNDFDVEFALIGRESPLSTVMLESGEWREVYQDDMAVILTRASP
jgi:hypothetical protein